ncbi:serine/threonine protein kinase [Elasticomyces elasticus]|nr:serine/threonine protein kinase [Elasticomyces elasticus]KAK4914665.1 serine/threonine protein kinase [Elasticomyces elasticus]KAK5753022.1 serine/threonine protein kinase [Elasticomyces elasticus]
MAHEKSSLKRGRNSTAEEYEPKKPRRSARLDPDLANENGMKGGPLPSPVTRQETSDTENYNTGTATPPEQPEPRTPQSSPPKQLSQFKNGLSSPMPEDTQPYSQFLAPAPISYEVQDEEAEGVWGYLIPITGVQEPLVLKVRGTCPVPGDHNGKKCGTERVPKQHWRKKEEEYEVEKSKNGVPAEGYILGRHPECDVQIQVPTVSNRHCLLFHENKYGDSIAVVEDLSGNGTYVNDAIVGRNKRRELNDGDEISVLDQARFIFRYPRSRETNGFLQQYRIEGQLGKGHFATVYLATRKTDGLSFAVKKFEKRSGPGERSKVEGLQQEIAVLMSVSHPNVLCLKDTFDEVDGVYLVLELAPEGELFNWIVMKQKLTEAETRKVFIQLFQGVKYLHERNIVHRDIKPENILLLDKELNVKIADFGLAKIIGEESFTTTLCGTPSYVAPEILEQGNRRRYTRAVDVWSLGVVLYICLCGFPPFSDELYSPENPYTLSQQIKMGRFDYPSPYWDSVEDPALELIDRMLTVDCEKRITIDECLEHPWITGNFPTMKATDSTDGLTGALEGLDFARRKPVRERTLLASINEVKIEREVHTQQDGLLPVKVFDKNRGAHFDKIETPTEKQQHATNKAVREKGVGSVEVSVQARPADGRDPEEFAKLGGYGDQVLYDEADLSRYPDATTKAGAPGK